MGTYRAYGLDIAVPFSNPRYAAECDNPDLSIVYGPVLSSLDDAVKKAVCCQVSATCTLFNVDGTARYLVDGRTADITIDRDASAADDDVEAFLWGPVLAAWMYRHGHVVLHASSIDVNGRAVVLAGKPGSGKSTLAALFAKRGFRVLADDYCVINLSNEHQTPVVPPAHPYFKLWPDTMHMLGRDPGAFAPVRSKTGRRRVPINGNFCSHALPLACIFELAKGPWGATPLEGHARFFTQIRHTFHAPFQQIALGEAGPFAQCARLSGRTPLVRLTTPRTIDVIEELFSFLDRTFEAYT